MRQPDVLVLGGGVIGCSIAYHLAVAGAQVSVIERDSIGAHASSVAAGILTIRPHDIETGPLEELARDSLALYPELVAQMEYETGIDSHLQSTGILEVAQTEEEARLLGALDSPSYSWLSAAELHEDEPSLNSQLYGALLRRGPSHVTSARLVEALATASAQRHVRFETGVAVTGFLSAGRRVIGVKTSHGERSAQWIILATGAWTAQVSELLGLAIPLRPLKGEVIHLYQQPHMLSRVVYANGRYVVPRPDGTIVVGATREEAGFDTRVTVQGVHWLLSPLPELAPNIAHAEFRGGFASVRPSTPDEWPLLGPVDERPGLIIATGHGGNGILLAPITGHLITDYIARNSASDEMTPFSLGRFAGAGK